MVLRSLKVGCAFVATRLNTVLNSLDDGNMRPVISPTEDTCEPRFKDLEALRSKCHGDFSSDAKGISEEHLHLQGARWLMKFAHRQWTAPRALMSATATGDGAKVQRRCPGTSASQYRSSGRG